MIEIPGTKICPDISQYDKNGKSGLRQSTRAPIGLNPERTVATCTGGCGCYLYKGEYLGVCFDCNANVLREQEASKGSAAAVSATSSSCKRTKSTLPRRRDSEEEDMAVDHDP